MSNKFQALKQPNQQFVICVKHRDAATDREFIQPFGDSTNSPIRFDSVNDCVQYLRDKVLITEDELDAGAFKFINFSHIMLNADEFGRVFDYDPDWFLPRTDIYSEPVAGYDSLWKFQLLNVADYKPYCSNGLCLKKGEFSVEHMQFKCACGRVENDDPEFLQIYGKVWVKDWAMQKD